MFESLTAAPPDAILGLTEAFKSDTNPNKINLGVGVYKSEDGITPVLQSVKVAEDRILTGEKSKSYLPIDGSPAYTQMVQALNFGADHPVLQDCRAVTAQTPGGTGALRVAADFINKTSEGSKVWLSEPTWPNHPAIFAAADVGTRTYPYFDAENNCVDFDAMMATVREIPPGDVLLLHGCCHNPTGADLSSEQWQTVAEVVSDRRIVPLLDFAYQGFGNGLVEDAAGLMAIAGKAGEFLVASSFSKNFGLYSERTGALTVVAQRADDAQAALSHVKKCIRANYSNPPSHGSAIVTTVLGDVVLREQWEQELSEMRDRINEMRHLFVETLNEKSASRDFSFIAKQRGMFSFSGLTPEHVQALRDKHSIYIVGSGRINVAGMTASNMDYLCEAIVDVLG